MKVLLDTHLLLWAAGASERLPHSARALIEDLENRILWEVAIKNGLGRADFRVDPRLLRRGLLENGYTELAVSGAHRILVAQAQAEGITLLTADALVARYPGPIRMV